MTKRQLLAALLPCVWAMFWGCANDDVRLGVVPEDAGAPTNIIVAPPSAEGGGAETSAPEHVLACIGTECPAPYATCATGPSFKCQTNLMTDSENCGACGACGASCGDYGATNMAARCVDGKCALECQFKENGGPHQFADCNRLLDDGCEVDLSTDHDNCGVCGHSCGENEHCIKGKCGCSSGQTDCNGTCVDTRSDSANCGACGNVCPKGSPKHPLPDPCGTRPPNTTRGCGGGECGQLLCQGTFRDCNNDLGQGCESDGCEIDTASDKNNCGACGNKCGPNQECRDDGNGPQCVGSCESAGLTTCDSGCKDLLSDPKNCGACGNYCRGPAAHQASACVNGLCRLDCLPGFADCNGDPSDGCEIDIRSHPANCGVCGHECDFGAGQPCIEGKCLMVECGPEGTK